VDFSLNGDSLDARVVKESSTAYSTVLRERIIAALPPSPTSAAEICQLDVLIGDEFAKAASTVADDPYSVDLIVSHGQTMYHWVDGAHARGSLQVGQAAVIAEALGAPVLADIRSRDIAAGGHGAPLVSILDELLLRDREGRSGALNLGGISNITVVEAGHVTSAYDIGPANALIDAAVREHGLHPAGYDAGGAIARQGTVSPALLDMLLQDPYYGLPAPKSTGKELFHPRYVTEAIEASGSSPSPVDIVTTLTRLTIDTVVAAVRAEGLSSLLVSGGGCRNETLMEGITSALPEVAIQKTDAIGLPSDAKEAVAFALIGWLSWHGLPGAVPAATGARRATILGSFTPGALGLSLPTPLESSPRTIRLRTPDSA
jgi:anhydro-N-acetylmuramic acid kinase